MTRRSPSVPAAALPSYKDEAVARLAKVRRGMILGRFAVAYVVAAVLSLLAVGGWWIVHWVTT